MHKVKSIYKILVVKNFHNCKNIQWKEINKD